MIKLSDTGNVSIHEEGINFHKLDVIYFQGSSIKETPLH